MSRTWKWILGVLAALILVGLIVCAVFVWQNQTTWQGPRAMMFNAPAAPGFPQGTPAPGEENQYPRYHMREWGGRMPMMYYGGGMHGLYGYGPFGAGFMMLGGLFHLLIPLGVLALIAYVFYQMGKRAGMGTASAPPSGEQPTRKVVRR